MTNIKILTPEIYNLISAGEVVETPLGALKELVENSIDAGATRISIEAENGGFDLISVADNGCGIREDDVETAFLKHATSKLPTIETLEHVQTLGFRGEALPSIAAVSKIKMTTRHTDSDAAVVVMVENGKVTSKQYASFNIGTKIEVRDLFYNTPARKKFFKTPKREGTELTKFVAKLILSNPSLEIIYNLDGIEVYRSNGQCVKDAIFAVYGPECVANCMPVTFSRGDYRLYGYIGSPDYSKANRNYQTLSVNARIIDTKDVLGAIMQAYRPYLMTKRHPFFVLNIDAPYDKVDVNVHPKKSEVRFAEKNIVCSTLYRGIKNALEEYSKRIRIDRSIYDDTDLILDKEALDEKERRREIAREQNANKMAELFAKKQYEIMNSGQKEDVIEIEEATEKIDSELEFEKFAQELERDISVDKVRQMMGFEVEHKPVTLTISQKKAAVDAPKTVDLLPPMLADKDEYDELYKRTRILGAAFKTYLILEIDDEIIFVDQHAAHERILFDKFMLKKNCDMQPVMFPYVFTVSDDEGEFINDNIDNILSAGIQIEPFGVKTYRIVAVSTLLADVKMNEFVQYLLSSVDEFKLDDRELIVEKIAKKACKAAIKGGYCLNEYEIKYILKEVCENKILQCPHGRPVTVVITKRQLEKMFKRIV